VTDNYGVSWSFTKIVEVVNIFIDLLASPPSSKPELGVYVGTPVHISANVRNNSTIPIQNATIMVSVEGQLLKRQSFNLDSIGGTGQITGTASVVWNTTGLIPRVYRIDAYVPPVPNQNTTASNYAFSYVQFIVPPPTGSASLSLFQSTGIGILVLIGAGLALFRFRRKPSYLNEP
jgi:hypothetical protein